MPPKKQEEEPAVPIVVWTVLPIVFNCPLAIESLKKPVNIKKMLDTPKLIELLKEKGIEKYMNQGVLTRQGELFLCQNIQSIGQQFLVQSRKPADPKKDQKKDSKKDSKKEEVIVQEGQKTIQFDFQKGVTEFMFYVNIPCDSQALETAVKSGFKPEVVVWIQQKIKEGTQVPNYNLLNNQRTIDDFMNQMNSTSPQKLKNSMMKQDISKLKNIKKQPINVIKKMRAHGISDLEHSLIIQVPFQKDLQHPQRDIPQFLATLFKKLCSISLQRQKYDTWRKNQKITTMIPTIKQTIKREVVVQQKKQDKKGSKKDPVSQPVTEIIEQVIQKRYESFPQNIKSDLATYKRISQQRKKDQSTSIYFKVLQDLAYSISVATQPQQKIPDFKQFGQAIWARQKAKPVGRVGVSNLKDKLRPVFYSSNSQQLHYKLKFQSHPIPVQVSLSSIIQQFPMDKQVEHQYKLKQFTELSKIMGKRVFFTFEDRKYVQKLESHVVNSLINQQLEFDPRVFYGKSQEDGYNIMIISRVNPPGRILFKNNIFDWKVLPNFQYWQQTFQNKQQKLQLWDYDWKKAGNLKIISKRMMPTDNSVIVESLYCSGDIENRLITLIKDNIQYGLRQISPKGHLFWKHSDQLRTTVYTHENVEKEINDTKNQIKISIQEQQFIVQFSPNISIIWSNNALQSSRQFGPSGEITRRLKNGTVQILYPNGDISTLKFGTWTHIKSNCISTNGQPSTNLKLEHKIHTDKHIELRQDSTAFVTYPNGDRSIIFKDGTIIRRLGSNKIQILNPHSVVIRVILGREKDFNVIGAGSAFAYLGETNLLQRSYNGGLYEFYHHSFSWHSYTEGIDRQGTLSFEKVSLIAYPDKSMIKVGSNGHITFLNRATQAKEAYLHERWIQLFTAAEYHREGVYDVDLIQGEIYTKDAQSNFFNVRVDGTGKTEIAVSFNVGNNNEEKNQQKNGFHIPEQNFFLPAPQNSTPPRLFVLYPDGKGEEYLIESQVQELKSWRAVKTLTEGRNLTQYSRQIATSEKYLDHSFSERVSIQAFTLPNLLEQNVSRPNLVKYNYSSVEFRSIQQITWDPSFSKLKQIQNSIITKKLAIENEIASLRNRAKF